MILSQLILAYLHYLELSLTVLQNYSRIKAFANLWLSPLKYQNWKNNNNKIDERIIKKVS